MAARAKNRKNFKQHLLHYHLADFNQTLELFLGRSSTKIAQTVPLRSTKWLPELKIEKTTTKQYLLRNHWMDFNQT